MEDLKLIVKNGSMDLKKMGRSNFLRAFSWIIVWFVCFVFIRGPISASFQTYCELSSIHEFHWKLLECMIWTLLLTVLWWLIAANSCRLILGTRLRNFLEEYSFIASLAFIVLEFFGVLIIYTFFGNAGIYATNGWLHSVWSIYAFPVVFVALMYACPPINIEKVILPISSERYLVSRISVTVIAIIIAVALFAIDMYK